MKNPIADDPVSNMTELDRRLRINFLGDEHGRGCCVSEKVLVSSYRQTQEHEARYATYTPWTYTWHRDALDVDGEYQALEDIEEGEDVHSLLRSTAVYTDEEDEPLPQ
eukprot:COSAG01_NODE_1524_length_10019_cov_6.258367_4_plen_108_part_00